MKSWLQDGGQRQSGEAGTVLGLRAAIPPWSDLTHFSNMKMQHPRQLLGNPSLIFPLSCCAIMFIRPVILAAAIGTWVAHIHCDGPWNLEWRQWKLHRQVMTAYQSSIDESWKLCSMYFYLYLVAFMLWEDICCTKLGCRSSWQSWSKPVPMIKRGLGNSWRSDLIWGISEWDWMGSPKAIF